MKRWAKWYQCMLVTWSNLMVYKVNFLLQMIAPLFVFLFVKVSVWNSIYESTSQTSLSGYSLPEMLSYHLWILIISLLVMSSSGPEVSMDIRLGRITTYLIYPFSLFEFHVSKFIASFVIKCIIAGITIVGAVWFASLQFGLFYLIQGLLLCLFSAFFWFFLNYFFALIAFWLEETWTFSVMIQVIGYFLSGAIIPLEMYPKWMQESLMYTPFPYMGFVPAKIFMGRQELAVFDLLVLSAWSIIIGIATFLIWRKGIKMYTAAGM